MRKFYIVCGIFCFCFLCVGLYFLISPKFSDSTSSLKEETVTEDDSQDEIIYFLTVDYSEINLFVGDSAQIKYTILPIHAVPSIHVENHDIIELNNFIITAKQTGKTKIILTHQNFTKEIEVNVLEKELNLTFDQDVFVSGKNSNQTYENYTAILKFNFDYTNIILNNSDNVVIISQDTNVDKIIFTFNIIEGTNFTFDITLDEINIIKVIDCSEFEEILPDTDDPLIPDYPEDPPKDPEPEITEKLGYYSLYYNGIEFDEILYYSYKSNQINYLIIEFKLFDNEGNKIQFNSNIEILDPDNITKNSLTPDYEHFTILVYSKGEIEITLTSNSIDISKTFKIIVE